MFFKHQQILDIKKFYSDNGFVVIKDFFLEKTIHQIKNNISKKLLKKVNNDFYFEITNKKKEIRRVERITDHSRLVHKISHSKKLYDLLKSINKNKQLLFKDKLNCKFPNSMGFLPHLDGHFYWKDKNNKINRGWQIYSNNFTNVAIHLEKSSIENGCLYIANYKDTFNLGKTWDKITKKLTYNTPNIKRKDLTKFNFIPFQVDVGDLIIFDWLCAHYSKRNMSKKSRMILYLTYCNRKVKNVREKYYMDKKFSSNSIGFKSCIYK